MAEMIGTGDATVNVTLDHPHVETRTLAVPAAAEARQRARMAVAGWKFQYAARRSDGSIELTFARRKLAACEKEA